jgi:DNA-binding transcriptional ArsR family regulator
MSAHIDQMKADYFKAMSHPARVRILELLGGGDQVVADLVTHVGLEPSHLSQQLSVLRRTGLVTSSRRGSAVVYSLADPRISDLLEMARSILLEQLTASRDQLASS